MVRTPVHKTKKLSLPRFVSHYFPFQGAEWGMLWAERQILSYLHSLVGVIPMKPTKRPSALMARWSLDMYWKRIVRSSELVRYISRSNNFLLKAYLHRSGMTSNSFASHNRACFCKAWVGKYSPCKWYTAYTPCVLGATHASYRLIRSVCLFGKCSCYGNLDIQCTASRNPRFTQWSLSWKCGFEELVPAQNKMPYKDSQYLSSAVNK